MRVGIVGLAQSGKKTLLQLLTGVRATGLRGAAGDFPVGAAGIPDERVDRLAAIYKPKKTRYAEIEWVLLPAMPKAESSAPKMLDRWLDAARQLDGICILARAFEDPGVYHEDGSVGPARDLEKLDLELAFADLALIETRLERMAKETAKKTAAEREKQHALLEGFRGELEAGRPLGALELSEADKARLSGLRFLTAIPALVAVNVDEDVAADGGRVEELAGSLPLAGRKAACFSAKFEAELGDIEDPKERDEFMRQYGIAESARVKLARAAVETLGQVSFLTANPNEVRAWLVREGATAPEAAGQVHTDFERGFIRAERMVLEELEAAGSESALRERGRVELKGKDYLVQDGDILHILAGR